MVNLCLMIWFGYEIKKSVQKSIIEPSPFFRYSRELRCMKNKERIQKQRFFSSGNHKQHEYLMKLLIICTCRYYQTKLVKNPAKILYDNKFSQNVYYDKKMKYRDNY